VGGRDARGVVDEANLEASAVHSGCDQMNLDPRARAAGRAAPRNGLGGAAVDEADVEARAGDLMQRTWARAHMCGEHGAQDNGVCRSGPSGGRGVHVAVGEAGVDSRAQARWASAEVQRCRVCSSQ
jgi:hypothetical protein